MAFGDRDMTPPRMWVTSALLGVLLIAFVAVINLQYFVNAYAGIGVLLLIPAAIGGLISELCDPRGKNPPMGCFFWPTVGLLVIFALARLIFGEGAICIAMVLPIWVPAAMLGAIVNRYNARCDRRSSDPTQFNSIAWLSIPFLLVTAEAASPPDWQSRSVIRDIIIDAKPAAIWPLLVRVPNIAASEGRANLTQDILRVPRPTEADLETRQGKLVRIAHWGRDLSFEEIITREEVGRSLSWAFNFPDNSVQHHTDHHISPDGPLLKIETGRYDLQTLDDGRTRLRLTTRYRMRTRLGAYLGWWAEQMLGDVQGNVLAIIRDRSENKTIAEKRKPI